MLLPATLAFSWLIGLIDPPTGFDAHKQARAYVRERLPLTTEFRPDDWRRDLPCDDEENAALLSSNLLNPSRNERAMKLAVLICWILAGEVFANA